MYVSVPKNYSGMAFRPDVVHPAPPRPEPPPPPPSEPVSKPCPEEEVHTPDPPACENCHTQNKNPLTCLMQALRNREKSGFSNEDFLLIGLIALLLGKEGNEDILLILTMLLIM